MHVFSDFSFNVLWLCMVLTEINLSLKLHFRSAMDLQKYALIQSYFSNIKLFDGSIVTNTLHVPVIKFLVMPCLLQPQNN